MPFSSRRSTMASMKPFSSRNSLRWKPSGQLLADGLFDHARPRKPNQRPRFRDVQVAQHRKARGHASRGGVGQNREIGQSGPIEPSKCGADLGHLHQGQRPLHHPRATRARHHDERLPLGQGHFGGARDLLAHHHAHAAADEGVLHGGDDDRHSVDGARADDDGVSESGLLNRGRQPIPIRLGIGELQWVGRSQKRVVLGPSATVEQHGEPFGGGHAEVMATVGTDLKRFRQVLVVERTCT